MAQVCLVLSTRYGIGNHLEAVDPTYLGIGFLYDWIFNVCTILSTGFGKLAILDILLQIQGQTNKTKRWILYFVGASTMLLNINQSIIVWLQCEPRDKLWNAMKPGSCNAQHIVLSLGVFQGSKSPFPSMERLDEEVLTSHVHRLVGSVRLLPRLLPCAHLLAVASQLAKATWSHRSFRRRLSVSYLFVRMSAATHLN